MAATFVFLRAGLPFSQVLLGESVRDAMKEFGLSLTEPIDNALVTTWVFLSQVLSSDQSCRAAVSRLRAHRAACGETPSSTPQNLSFKGTLQILNA